MCNVQPGRRAEWLGGNPTEIARARERMWCNGLALMMCVCAFEAEACGRAGARASAVHAAGTAQGGKYTHT